MSHLVINLFIYFIIEEERFKPNVSFENTSIYQLVELQSSWVVALL